MFQNIFSRLVKRLWEQLDTLLALILAAGCSILGLVGVASPSILASATLGTLTVLAIALMRDRSDREKAQQRLDGLISQLDEPIADLLFKHKNDETPLLQEAEREVWMVQETGSLIFERNTVQVASLLRRGGTVRIVVAVPTKSIIHQLSFRNHQLTPDAIKTRSNAFSHEAESLLRSAGTDVERLQVRFIPYPSEVTSVLADPRSEVLKKRRAVVRYAGFLLPYEEKLDFSIQAETSPQTFSHYFLETQQLFAHASKIVLLTGEPLSGKTTMINQLIEGISPEEHVFLFTIISRAIWNGSERTGFEVITSRSSGARRFATRQSDGSYDVDAAVWTSVATELEQAYADKKVIIVDEIGPMQLKSQAFIDVIEKILQDPTATMFATIALENKKHPLLRKMKFHYRSTVYLLTQNEMKNARIKESLEQEMKASLYLAARIPHVLWEPM